MFRIEENRDKVAGEGGRYKNKCSRYKGFLDKRSDEGKIEKRCLRFGGDSRLYKVSPRMAGHITYTGVGLAS